MRTPPQVSPNNKEVIFIQCQTFFNNWLFCFAIYFLDFSLKNFIPPLFLTLFIPFLSFVSDIYGKITPFLP